MLGRIRSDVLHRVEPTYSSFVAANESRARVSPFVWYADPEYVPHPRQIKDAVNGWIEAKDDAQAAYTHALLWYITRDARHARKAAEIMDAWSAVFKAPPDLSAGLQAGFTGAVWPRAAEIIRHTARDAWSDRGIAAFEGMLTRAYLPLVDEGSDSNGGIGLVMTEAAMGIGVFTGNRTTFDRAVALWRGQAPAYLYTTADGETPRRPPAQRHLAHTSPICGPNCTDEQMVTYWHGQREYSGHDGICQETCRDLPHTMLGMATLINSAETAWHQGVDLYAEAKTRLVPACELHASLLAIEPLPYRQEPVPSWLCGGRLKNANRTNTLVMAYHHYVVRLGEAAMPNVSALLPHITPRDDCWDQQCWEALTHGGRAADPR